MIRARVVLLLTLIREFFARVHESAVGTELPNTSGALKVCYSAPNRPTARTIAKAADDPNRSHSSIACHETSPI
jgi:hypothetical protein